MERYFTKDKTNIMNQNTYDYLFCEYYFDEDRRMNLEKTYYATRMIEEITKGDEEMLKMATSFIDNPLPVKYEEESGYYIYTKDDLDLRFKFLSNSIDDQEEKRILESDERYGRCNQVVISLLENNESFDIEIGYMNTPISKILHTIVVKDNKVYDYTKNLIMPKEDYYRLTNYELLNKTKSEDLKEEIKMVRKINIPLKAYLVFRNEMNKKILKLEH